MQYITNEELCRAQSNAISLDNMLKTLEAMDSPDENAKKHCKLQLDRYDALQQERLLFCRACHCVKKQVLHSAIAIDLYRTGQQL